MAMEKFRAPSLPNPVQNIDEQYVRQVLRVLEIYFSQLDSKTPRFAESYRADNFFGGVHSGDGYALRMPHISAADNTDQFATADDTPTQVLWDTLETAYGFTLEPSGSAVAIYGGVYKIDYSIQFVNTDNTAHDVFLWLEVNGGQVDDSSSRFTIPARKSATEFGYSIAYSSVTFGMAAGDDVRLYWATEKAYNPVGPVDGVYMEHIAPQTTPYARPQNPSAVGSITFVSALP